MNFYEIVERIRQGEKRNLQFGDYEWRVLKMQGNEALLLSEYIIEDRPYNIKQEYVTWETCTLRKYLNGEFLNKFQQEEQGLIIEKTIGNPDNLWYGTAGGKDTKDKIFLLSLEEADEYFGNSGDYKNKRKKSEGYYFSNKYDSDRVASYRNSDNGSDWWRLRSPGDNSGSSACVDIDGGVYVGGFDVYFDYSVRPACWLNL